MFDASSGSLFRFQFGWRYGISGQGKQIGPPRKCVLSGTRAEWVRLDYDGDEWVCLAVCSGRDEVMAWRVPWEVPIAPEGPRKG